ncbi:ABC-three component system protein [Tardiphaga sp. 866_E4_N2_1]|uniref:ABC-three component system protein n=1 Tax=unclassified Tardiphaga TaxID=2631404 RepID=UPI003F21A5D9
MNINQTGANAGGDIVGGNKYEQHYHPTTASPGIVDKLLRKLHDEVTNNQCAKDTIEALAHFHTRRAHDGIHGLEAKLKKADRENEYLEAIEKKEQFSKLLERWSLYASAQEIFAYLLAKAEYEFTYVIRPQIASVSPVQVNELIRDRIVTPTVNECGASVFTINHSTAMGMVYWLAEQCFVRWHK